MKREIVVDPTVPELATAFAELAATEQVEFFHEVAVIFLSWSAYHRDRQTLDIGERLLTSEHATELVRAIVDAGRASLASGEKGPVTK